MDFSDNLLNITYENGASSIHMVVRASSALPFINYQYEMITNNECRGILKTNMRRKNDSVLLYYDITSRLSLTQYLKGRKLTREEFLDIIGSIIKTVCDSKGYLLYEHCFLLNMDNIFIKPGTSDVQLAYLPYEFQTDSSTLVKKLLIEIIMASDFAETSSDNYLQRILSNIKADAFSLNGLRKLLREISCNTGDYEGAELKNCCDAENTSEDELVKITSEEKRLSNTINIGWGFVSALVSQIFVLFVIYSVLKSDLISDTLTKYCVCIVVAAIDIFIALRLLHKKPDNAVSQPIKEQPAIDATVLLNPNDTALLFRKQQARLQRNKDGVLEEITITKDFFTIGRMGGQADYSCKNNAVGRVHAEISFKDGVYFIRDLNSRNGTFLNGERLESNREYKLNNDDRISFANSEFNFTILQAY